MLSISEDCSEVLMLSEVFSVHEDSVLSSTVYSQEKSVESSVKDSDACALASTLVQDSGVLGTLVSSLQVYGSLLSAVFSKNLGVQLTVDRRVSSLSRHLSSDVS